MWEILAKSIASQIEEGGDAMFRSSLKIIGVLVGLLALAACARTEQIRDVDPSGFLDPSVYAKLQPGKGELEAALVYRAPDADYAKYDKILLDPIVAFAPPGEQGDLQPQDKQALLNNFYTLTARELEKDYPLVIGPEPKTLRLQFAMIEATKKNVTMDTISTLMSSW